MTTFVDASDWAVQYDTATFPDSSPVTFAALGYDINLSVDADNGSATVQVYEVPGAIDDGVRIYCYASGVLVFHGFVTGITWGADSETSPAVHQITCVDALFKLRNAWGGEDRQYDSLSGDTDTNVAQNIVEASGIDASLTSIMGEDRPIGTAQDVIIHGGNLDIDGNPSQQDVMIEFIRLLDRSVIPNHATFTRGDGAVYRRPREIGGSVASFADGASGNAWGFQRQRVPGSIVNKWLVRGLTIANVPTEAEASAANAYLTAPWEYNGAELSSYLVDDPTWAQDLADWKVSDTNGRLNQVSWTGPINNQTDILGSTVTVTSGRRGLSSTLVYVTSIRHHRDEQTATSTYSAEFRD